MSNPADACLAVPARPHYARLRDRACARADRATIEPSVLWNDICWPAGWRPRRAVRRLLQRACPTGSSTTAGCEPPDGAQPHGGCPRAGGRHIAAGRLAAHPGTAASALTFPAATTTTSAHRSTRRSTAIQEKKWESTRGVGHSFGANRNERPAGHRDRHRTRPLLLRHREQERQPAHRHRPGARRQHPGRTAGPAARSGGVAAGQRRGDLRFEALDGGRDDHHRGHAGSLHPARRDRLRRTAGPARGAAHRLAGCGHRRRTRATCSGWMGNCRSRRRRVWWSRCPTGCR